MKEQICNINIILHISLNVFLLTNEKGRIENNAFVMTVKGPRLLG